jgi:hypothetical protein
MAIVMCHIAFARDSKQLGFVQNDLNRSLTLSAKQRNNSRHSTVSRREPSNRFMERSLARGSERSRQEIGVCRICGG